MDQPCSEKHLGRIAKELESWERIYMFLELTRAETEVIKSNHPGDYEYQKLQVLYKWREKKGLFQGTFQALINIFAQGNDPRMVDIVRNMAAEITTGKPTLVQPRPGGPSTLVGDIEHQFRLTVRNIKQHLRRCDIQNLVTDFVMEVKQKDIPYLKNRVLEKLYKCRTIGELFIRLSPFISWQKRDVLRVLVEVSDSEEAIDELNRFEAQLSPTSSINDFPLPLPSNSICPDLDSDITMVTMRSNEPLRNVSWQQTEHLQEMVAEQVKSTAEHCHKDFQPTDMFLINGPYEISCDGQAGAYFVWKDYGLELKFPVNCTQKEIKITVSSFLPFNNQLSSGEHIVSSIYQLDCNVICFDKAVTLSLQHCIKLVSLQDCQKMCFVIQNDSVKRKVKGKFNMWDAYGTVEITTCSFCYIYIMWEAEGYTNSMTDKEQGKSTLKSMITANNGNKGASSNPSSSSSDVSKQTSTDDKYNSSNTTSSNNSCSDTDEQQLQLTKKLIPDTSPLYTYEEMLGVPSHRSSITNKSWCGVYSLYPCLDGWKSFIIEAIEEERNVDCYPLDVLTSEVEFNSPAAILKCRNRSENSWYTFCDPDEIKKTRVDLGYFKVKETDNPTYSRYHSQLLISKSLMYIKKRERSSDIPLDCHLVIEGVQPPQDIDILADSQKCITLYTQLESKCSFVKAGPSMCPTVYGGQQGQSSESGILGKRSSRAYQDQSCDSGVIEKRPLIEYQSCNSGILGERPLMEHLVEFVIPLIKSYWDDVAYILGFEVSQVEGVAVQCNDIKQCCRKILIDWLNTSHGHYPKTWSTLLENLSRITELTAIVENIRQRLQQPSVVQKYM